MSRRHAPAVRRRLPLSARAAVLFLIPLIGGCYSYVRASPESLIPPTPVRAHLSSEGAAGVAEVLGEPRIVLDGELTAVTPAGIFLVVPAAMIGRGTRTESLNQQLLIPSSELVALERRILDRGRSGALAGAIAAAAGVILYRTLSGDRGGGRVPPGGGGSELRLPAAPFPPR